MANSTLASWVDSGLIEELVASQLAVLDEVEGMLLDAERGAGVDLPDLARRLHTLKGEVGLIGSERLQIRYHEMEEWLREPGLPQAAAALLQAIDVQRQGLTALRAGEQEPATVVAPPVAQAAQVVPEPPMPASEEAVDPEMEPLFKEFQVEAVEGLVRVDELLLKAERGETAEADVHEVFRVFHSIKGVAGFVGQGAIVRVAHATEQLMLEAREGRRAFAGGMVSLVFESTGLVRLLLDLGAEAFETRVAAVEPPGVAELVARLRSACGGNMAAVPLPAPTPVDAPPAPTERGESAGSRSDLRSIRVDLQRVDALVGQIGELVVVEAMLAAGASMGQERPETRRHLAVLGRIVRDLQAQGLGLRMVPLRALFQKMARLVRDVSHRSGKQVRLEVAGEDTEIDRSLVEYLSDPLVHLIRNAVDHGVESAEDRLASGKSATGTLTLSAEQKGGSIVVRLSDDGKGLDRDRILRKAVERGLVSADAVLDDAQIHNLIFEPGFSTASQVTDLSGRGVGMDVVKKNVEAIRGRVRIESAPGRGTTFDLVVPLTLAIIDGMLVEVAGQRFVLPTLAIHEAVWTRPGQIVRYTGRGEMIDLRGQLLPVVRLADVLGVGDEVVGGDEGLILVTEGASNRYGLFVDQVLGKQQVVIKGLDVEGSCGAMFSGAAVLGDGRVGLILNPLGLVSGRAGAEARA